MLTCHAVCTLLYCSYNIQFCQVRVDNLGLWVRAVTHLGPWERGGAITSRLH